MFSILFSFASFVSQSVDPYSGLFKMKKVARLVLGSIMVASLAACASQVTPMAETKNPEFNLLLDSGPATSVKLVDDQGFERNDFATLAYDREEFLNTVEERFTSAGILTPNSTAAPVQIEITMRSMNFRSGAAATMLGVLSGVDELDGDVVVKNPDGTVLQSFSVGSDYAFGGALGGIDSVRLSWLYESFADSVISTLGAEPPVIESDEKKPWEG